ncbi:MAG: hypothetical protein PHX87_04765 [Candidatus Peribacteraceae bacterium]|nr:hypothetical protein [Candidatus Peribacteraceae bacterium]MDD5742709.1 hypothetical protein [Candidatus Peribacteraceae bacterium]
MIEEPLHPDCLLEVPAKLNTVSEIEALVRRSAHPVLESRAWRELAAGWESGEISREAFGWNDVVRVYRQGRPIARSDVQNRPVILTAVEVEKLRVFDFVFRNGETELIDQESVNGVLVLLPRDFGDPR